jgi:ATP phosphoribosyltransferase regulatory subunit
MTEARNRALALRANFEAAGAVVVEPPVLQPAEALLDLYGEDIRARAYITSDALRGEQMLRPDFTVPVVQMHMADGAEPARYTYAGEVFRRQEDDLERASEFLQVGYEVFDRSNPAATDAEVFTLVSTAVSHLDVRASTGDIGILMAAVRGLKTSERRKAALIRHVWRPRRFRALLDRFSGRSTVPESRLALLADPDPFQNVGAIVGTRTRSEISTRVAALREDAMTDPISSTEMDVIDALLNVRETVPFALEQLRDLAVDMPEISHAVEGLHARSDALSGRGVDVDNLAFEASYGRTSMEYYDGFVFGFYINGRADLPALASGGRYDALTKRLGNGAEIPAVGAVLRPGLMVELEGAQ